MFFNLKQQSCCLYIVEKPVINALPQKYIKFWYFNHFNQISQKALGGFWQNYAFFNTWKALFNPIWFSSTNSLHNHSGDLQATQKISWKFYWYPHLAYIYLCKMAKIWIFHSFLVFAQLPSAQNIKTFFACGEKKIVIGNLILFFLNNFKSTATMVTPKFRFILLKILNKIMFGK